MERKCERNYDKNLQVSFGDGLLFHSELEVFYFPEKKRGCNVRSKVQGAHWYKKQERPGLSSASQELSDSQEKRKNDSIVFIFTAKPKKDPSHSDQVVKVSHLFSSSS